MYIDDMDDIFSEGKVFKRLHNNEINENLYIKDNGDVVDSEDNFIANKNNDDFDDIIENYENDWYENNWSKKDWADWYGCREDEVDEVMEDDDKW